MPSIFDNHFDHEFTGVNMSFDKSYSLAIVGGGINGLCAAYNAIKRAISPVVLIEQFNLGHNRGSSHGHSRITRSAYTSEDYVRLMQVAHKQALPDLERDLGTQLIYPTEGCFFGPADSKYDAYAEAVSRVGVDCTEISVEEARKKYPQFRFNNIRGVLLDRTAGLIDASNVISHLSQYVRERIDVIEDTEVKHIDLGGKQITLNTSVGQFCTNSAILTAGPWAKKLIPELSPVVSVARQVIAYVKLAASPESHQLGQFPVWGNLHGEGSLGYYGLPEFGQPGIKVAKHVIWGRDDDPDRPEEPSQEEIEELSNFVAECFEPPLEEIVNLETCHYTNTDDEDYIIDQHPENESCIIGSGFSGHGFKLGPVTGRTLVDLATDGEPSIEAFTRAQGRFALGKKHIPVENRPRKWSAQDSG